MTKKRGEALPAKKKGRPSSFNDKLALRILDLAKAGKTDKEIAENVGVSETTINNWKSAHPDFFEALKGCKNVADQLVVAALFQRAIGYSHPAVKILSTKDGIEVVPYMEHYPPDSTACFFWLQNRQPKKWRNVKGEGADRGDKSEPILLAYVPKSLRLKEGA